MIAALAVLSGCCILIGVLPVGAARLIEPVLASIFPHPGELLPSIQTTAHLYGLSIAAIILILFIIMLVIFFIYRLKSSPLGESGTWDCGYAAPAPTMQYTASSFAGMLVDIFDRVLRPQRHEPSTTALFPSSESFHCHIPEVVLDRGILPAFGAIDRRLAAIRRLQSGQLNRYILYICVVLILLLILSTGR
jgi:hydrogenase-4 component B